MPLSSGDQHCELSCFMPGSTVTSTPGFKSKISNFTSGEPRWTPIAAARPKPKLGDLPHELDRPDDHHGERPPGTRSRPLDPDLALSPESSNPKRSLGRCPLAPRR